MIKRFVMDVGSSLRVWPFDGAEKTSCVIKAKQHFVSIREVVGWWLRDYACLVETRRRCSKTWARMANP